MLQPKCNSDDWPSREMWYSFRHVCAASRGLLYACKTPVRAEIEGRFVIYTHCQALGCCSEYSNKSSPILQFLWTLISLTPPYFILKDGGWIFSTLKSILCALTILVKFYVFAWSVTTGLILFWINLFMWALIMFLTVVRLAKWKPYICHCVNLLLIKNQISFEINPVLK